jgi:hypothetical protein
VLVRTPLLLWGLISFSCGGEPGPGPVAPAGSATADGAGVGATADDDPALEDQRQFVLIEPTGRLYTQPDDGATSVYLGDPARAESLRERGEAVAFAVVRDLGDWIEVENLGREGADRHCHPGVLSLSSYRLRLFARRDALVPVVARAWEQRFDDGTAVRLSPGVMVAATEGDGGAARHLIAAGGLTGWVALGDAIGEMYRPAGATAPPELDRHVPRSTVERGALRYGGATLAPAPGAMSTYFAGAPRPAGAEVIATVHARCLQVDARLEPSALEPAGASDTLRLGESFSRTRVDRGAVAYWPDGEVAGAVIGPAFLDDEVEARGAMRCFSHTIARPSSPERPGDLTLCFAAADVQNPGQPVEDLR